MLNIMANCRYVSESGLHHANLVGKLVLSSLYILFLSECYFVLLQKSRQSTAVYVWKRLIFTKVIFEVYEH